MRRRSWRRGRERRRCRAIWCWRAEAIRRWTATSWAIWWRAGAGRAERGDGAVPVLGRGLAHGWTGLRRISRRMSAIIRGLSGLNLNFNRAYFEWNKGGTWPGRRAGRALYADGRHGPGRRGAARLRPCSPTPGPGRGMDSGLGGLGKGGSRWLPVRPGAPYVAEVFRTLARAQGIKLPTCGGAVMLSGRGWSGGKAKPWRCPARHAEVFHQPDRGMVGLTASGPGRWRRRRAGRGLGGRAGGRPIWSTFGPGRRRG